MAYAYLVNQTPATAAVAIYNLKTQLKAGGWTVPRSSDGTTYNSSGDQISSGSSGANGMDNARAWFVIQEPASPSRQFCFQRDNTTGANTSYKWRIKYSKGAGFTGGSPDAVTVPTATDEQFLLGSGTGTTVFAALFSLATDGGFRHQIVVDGASRYGWASFAWINTTGVPTHGLFYDPITSGTAADVDPSVLYLNGVVSASTLGGVAGSGVGQYESFARNYSKLFGYSNGTFAATIFGMILAVSDTGTWMGLFPFAGVVDDDTKDNLMGMPYTQFNTTSHVGMWKGLSSLLSWINVVRATGSTFSTTGAGSKDRVALCDVSLPWDGSTPTI